MALAFDQPFVVENSRQKNFFDLVILQVAALAEDNEVMPIHEYGQLIRERIGISFLRWDRAFQEQIALGETGAGDDLIPALRDQAWLVPPH